METEFENAVKKVLWALEPLPNGEQRVLALKEALKRLSEERHRKALAAAK
jgi:hypothetical protein